MHLGPDSAIDVFYDGRERRVQLLKGEAFFEVTPDAQRPFRVAARTVETTVLGTAFNVRLGSDDTEVAVRRGLVGVADTSVTPALSERLQPGAWVQVSRDGRAERGAFPPEEIAPWLHGQMIARDRRMADVVDELRRYYDGAIVVAGSGLGGRRVTGVYNLADPDAARAIGPPRAVTKTKLIRAARNLVSVGGAVGPNKSALRWVRGEWIFLCVLQPEQILPSRCGRSLWRLNRPPHHATQLATDVRKRCQTLRSPRRWISMSVQSSPG